MPLRTILFCIIVLGFAINIAAQKTNSVDSFLSWGSRKLKLSDFKGFIPLAKERGNGIATTTWFIDHSFLKREDTIRYSISCWFCIYESWEATITLRYTSPAYILNHEQKHFDIAEINARLIRKYFLDILVWEGDLATRRDIDSLIKVGDDLQELYDKETNPNGRCDTLKQRQWDVAIQKKLDELDMYKDAKGIVILNNKGKKNKSNLRTHNVRTGRN